MESKGRLLPDSAHTTVFGRPAWHAYGNGNTNPAQGGLIYGDYMKTHNINPHSGANKPEKVQIYARAQSGQQKVVGSDTNTLQKSKSKKIQDEAGEKKADPKLLRLAAKMERQPHMPRQH